MPRGRKTAEATPAAAAQMSTAAPMSFSPGPGWYTARQATEYLGGDPNNQQDVTRVRNAIKNRAEFKSPDAMRMVAIEGYDMPPLIYVSQGALDTYRENNVNGAATRVRDGAKRWIIRLTPDQEKLFEETFGAQQGVKLEVASTPKKKKTDAATASAADTNGTTPNEPGPESDEASFASGDDDEEHADPYSDEDIESDEDAEENGY